LGLAAAAKPGIREAFECLFNAAEATAEGLGRMRQIAVFAEQKGYPVFGHVVVHCPFDEFSDSIRGFMNTLMDLTSDPVKLNEAVCRWADISVPAGVQKALQARAHNVFIPLHMGIDEFMSAANYTQYYWPHLRRMVEEYIKVGITPILVCEGHYNTRLEQLLDVPKGKVLYLFEQVDIAAAKKALEGTACVGGNFPTAELITGTRESVSDMTKKLMDDCAPGGGYMMTNSLLIDNARQDLLEAWHEAAVLYGKY
jgi:uroporphyrinogen-III decarboxylase